MSKRWALGVCLVALGTFAMVGCASAPYVAGYSDAKQLQKDQSYDQAIQKFDEYVQMNPQSDLVPYAEYNIAVCELKLGDKDKAEAKLNDIVKLYSDSPVVQAHPDKNPVLWAQDDLNMMKEHPEVMMPAAPAAEMPMEQPSTEATPAEPAPAPAPAQ